jgi:hypothetical protein
MLASISEIFANYSKKKDGPSSIQVRKISLYVAANCAIKPMKKPTSVQLR